jgi:hypothetical protein
VISTAQKQIALDTLRSNNILVEEDSILSTWDEMAGVGFLPKNRLSACITVDRTAFISVPPADVLAKEFPAFVLETS